MSDISNSISHRININEEKSFLNNINKIKIIRDKTLFKEYKKTEFKELDYIYLAKILAVFSVVILHTNGRFWFFKYKYYKIYWISANSIESIFFIAVPIFFLCIGATLLDFNERYGLKKYYHRRFIKVVVPLLLWNILSYCYRVYFLKNLKKQNLNFISIWNLYYTHKINAIFFSFHQFLFVYLVIPLIAYVNKSAKIKIYSQCFITLFLTQSLIPYLISLFCPKLIWIYSINLKYIIYLFPGYIIQNYKFSKALQYIIYILGLIGFFLHLYGTKVLTLKYKKIIMIHKGYYNIPCILYSCSAFLFIKEYSYYIFKYIDRKYIKKIGSLTIGPFFIHILLIDTIRKYFYFNDYSFYYRFFGGIFVCIISLIITAIMKNIPLLNYLVP